ncbi:MAG: cob(I)yrinic acid a,c-diamide adenosyltransferase, partial [Gammaproteobacteria bacterium]|nr:cob(I)yrinic acid a,c-diamide adenosyltransferase [Gammaproteobacteria bacterium]
GTTSLFGGKRTDKSSKRIQAIGDMDELNSIIGVVMSRLEEGDIKQVLLDIQHGLFNIGSNLATGGEHIIALPEVNYIESVIDDLDAKLPPLTQFILPGGEQSAALCHLARAVCRRAERHLVELQTRESGTDEIIIFVNRLSDLLFVVARTLNQQHLVSEPVWDKNRWQ